MQRTEIGQIIIRGLFILAIVVVVVIILRALIRGGRNAARNNDQEQAETFPSPTTESSATPAPFANWKRTEVSELGLSISHPPSLEFREEGENEVRLAFSNSPLNSENRPDEKISLLFTRYPQENDLAAFVDKRYASLQEDPLYKNVQTPSPFTWNGLELYRMETESWNASTLYFFEHNDIVFEVEDRTAIINESRTPEQQKTVEEMIRSIEWL